MRQTDEGLPHQALDQDRIVLVGSMDSGRLTLELPRTTERVQGSRFVVSEECDFRAPGPMQAHALRLPAPVLKACCGLQLPGSPAEIAFVSPQAREFLPRDALIRYPDGRTIVWVAAVEGDRYVVEERQVKTGLTFDGKVEIIEGLSSGERVVIRGNEALRQGQQVRIAG